MNSFSTKSLFIITIGSFFAWAFIIHAGWQSSTQPVEAEPAIKLEFSLKKDGQVTEADYLTQMTAWVDNLKPQTLSLIDVTNDLGDDLHSLSQPRFLQQLSDQLMALQETLSSFPVYSADELPETCLASYKAFAEAKTAYESAIRSLHTTVEYSLLHLDVSTLKATISSSSDQLQHVVEGLEQGVSLLQF